MSSNKGYPETSSNTHHNMPAPLGFDMSPSTNPVNRISTPNSSIGQEGPPPYQQIGAQWDPNRPVPMPRLNKMKGKPPPYEATAPLYPQLSTHIQEEQQMPIVNPLSYKPDCNTFMNAQPTPNQLYNMKHGNISQVLIPPGASELYTGKFNIFFVQKEGHVISPKDTDEIKIFKINPTANTASHQASFSGSINEAEYLIVANPAWCLGVSKKRNYCIKCATTGLYGFHDTSTTPPRCVIIKMGEITTSSEIQRFNVLMNAAVSMANEPTSAVDKIENGIEGAYQSITSSVNTFVKESAPDVHKKTKWFRKGAASIVQTGSKLVSQGTHLVTDPLINKSKKGISHEQQEIINALKTYRTASDRNEITYVTSES